MKLDKFMSSIAQEKEGFRFGEPWRYTEEGLACILPILRVWDEERAYLVLAEAERVKLEDTGSISKILVINNEDKPVLVRSGEMFKGKTQARAAVVSRIIQPGKTAGVEVVCIHASHPISSFAGMKGAGVVPSRVAEAIASTRYDTGTAGQAGTWQAVSDFTYTAAAASPSWEGWAPRDDLIRSVEAHTRSIEGILRSVPYFDHQVGMVFLTLEGVKALECFDLEGSWEAIRDDVVRKEGEDLAKQDDVAVWEYRSERAEVATIALLEDSFEEKTLFEDEHSRILGLSTDDFVGQAVLLEDNVVYLNLLRRKALGPSQVQHSWA